MFETPVDRSKGFTEILVDEECEEEFFETDFQPYPVLLGATFASTSCFVLATCELIGQAGSPVEGNESFKWRIITAFPHILCVLYSIFILFLFNKRSASVVLQNYNLLCTLLIVMVYVCTIWFSFIREILRSQFQDLSISTVEWRIDFSSPIPTRVCNDSNPIRTWREWPYLGEAVGCNNLILSGNVVGLYAFLAMLPAVFRMNWRFAVSITIILGLILVVAVLSVGSRTWILLSALLFQSCAGLTAALACKNREFLAREQFSMAKKTDLAAQQNRVLLHTLIPEDVLDRIATRKAGDSLLGTQIPACTVLFCSLEPQAELQGALSEELFDFLSCVFCRFDDAVEQYGMFKYQHVVRRPLPIRAPTARGRRARSVPRSQPLPPDSRHGPTGSALSGSRIQLLPHDTPP